MKILNFFTLVMFTFILCACQKEKIEQKAENIIQEQADEVSEPEINEQIVEEKIQIIPDKDCDDSEFDDLVTTDFCLKDDKERTFCIFHNLYKVKDFDTENYEVVAEWATGGYNVRWCKQEQNDLSITWNYENGGIIEMETKSPKYSTKRGIRVGDSLSDIIKVYENDAEIYEYDYVNNKYDLISANENALFRLYKAENRVSIDAGNATAETIIEIDFQLENDIVTKIKILCGD